MSDFWRGALDGGALVLLILWLAYLSEKRGNR